ncbi:MAG: hypothetical protein RLZZ77_1868 [Bacteroidota bacterium]|jgi:glucose/arabinose dehydrogenase
MNLFKTLSASLLLFCLLFNQHLFAQSPSPVSIQLEVLATGLSTNSGVYSCGDHRLFIVERTTGDIEIIDTLGTYIGKFMDMTGLISTGSERGLLGLTFHPNYFENGFFYINYTDLQGNTVIARYSVSDSNPNLANMSSAATILTQVQPYSNHNGGDLAFGSDGYLYIGLGDGGSGGDPQHNGQNENTLLGKMLRIDVDSTFPYAIPPDNPFVGAISDSLPEIWDMGLRNPWRFSFDRVTGDLWIADVGQNNWEEVNFEPALDGGKNYGWRCYEGNHVQNPVGCNFNLDYDFPIAEYQHSATNFCAIIGGYVYRGSKYPRLTGHYILTDYCEGGLYSIYRNPDGSVQQFDLAAGPGQGNVALGQDANGELYLCNYTLGTIYRITEPCGTFQPTLADLGNGSIEVSAGSAYYWWKDGELIAGANNAVFSPSQSGTYYATVTNADGCTAQSNSIAWTVSGGVAGCTYAEAINYNPLATIDDGTCQFGTLGCTYPEAVNYNPEAMRDDGTCNFPLNQSCPLDFNDDGLVGIADLLIFIEGYGLLCD